MRIVRDAAGLEALAPAWDALAERSGRSGIPTQEHGWATACAAAFVAERELEIVTIGAPPHVTAIAPLARRRHDPLLQLLGEDELYEPMDLLYADETALAALTEALARMGVPLRLGRLPAGSVTVEALPHAVRGHGMAIAQPASGYPSLPLDASWVEPERHLNAGRRSDVRRARRIAESAGALTFTMSSPRPSELPALLEEAFSVEAAGWKGRVGSALARDPQTRRFYELYLESAAGKGTLRLCFLRVGGRAAAMQLAVESGGRLWLLKIGYDEEFKRCSPGTLLTLEAIRWAAQQGLRSYEFLGTVQPWTQMWGPRTTPCVALRVYPARARGVAALAADIGRFGWRRLSHALLARP